MSAPTSLKTNFFTRSAHPFHAFPRSPVFITRSEERTRFAHSNSTVIQSSRLEDSSAAVELPTRLNNVPHPRETRQFFYEDVGNGIQAAIQDGNHRIAIRCSIPETNPEMDVYRIGTLLEMIRSVVMKLAVDGKSVKVCVQQSMGEGVFQGLPLSLAGVRRIMEMMDWAEARPFVQFGQVGGDQITQDCTYYLLIAPQNIVGQTIVTYLSEMVEKAERENKVVVLVNPLLKDIPSSGGVMGIRGRAERMDFANSFATAYHFRLLYTVGTFFPIKGALRFVYGGKWEVYKRVSYGKKEEAYELRERFVKEPKGGAITEAIRRKPNIKKSSPW